MDDLLIPDLPPSPAFNSLEAAFDFLRTFGRENGVAFVKSRTAHPRIIAGKSTPTRICVVCDRGPRRQSKSVQLRQTATRKIDCQFQLRIMYDTNTNSRWFYAVTGGPHNHGPSLNPSAHLIHRRRTSEQSKLIQTLTKHKAVAAREVRDVVYASTAGPTHFTLKDVYYDRQKLRVIKLEGLTPTQQWVNLLQRYGLRHKILWGFEGDIRRPIAALWTFPWCIKMWKRFHEVLGLDNTYKTNRHSLYLFEVTGVTDHNSLANFAFGLMSGEKEVDFTYICKQLDLLRQELDIPAHEVVITDMEAALKNAVATTWPDTQQQMCIFHINQKVKARIRSQFDEPPSPIVNYDADDMIEHWDKVLYASKERDFEDNWQQLIKRYGDHQSGVIDYIESTYMPFREQWAQCFIRHYRNFGQRTNSPNETAHKDIKSYLLNGRGDLLTLIETMVQMLTKKERDYEDKYASMEMRQRIQYIGRDWLGVLPTRISYQAVDLLAFQHRLAQKALVGKLCLSCCEDDDCSFTQQFALPCAHVIKERIEGNKTLELEDVHPRWWLKKPLVGSVYCNSLFTCEYRLTLSSRTFKSHSFESETLAPFKTFAAGPVSHATAR